MRRDRGFALAAALMVLALLSVLGAAAIQSTTLEVKISAHDRDARAALYLAEAALEEARYQIARSWGGVERHAPNQVRVTAPAPTPAGFWDGQRYVGFTFIGDDGASFAITDHTPGPNPVVTVDSGDPAVGLFTVYKEFGAAVWDGATSRLAVADPGWAGRTAAGRWNGWLLLDGGGRARRVSDSGADVGAGTVWLRLPSAPGTGPYSLCLNPWLASRAGAGDWIRSFADPWSGDPLGQGAVRVEYTAAGATTYGGTYRLTATGTAARSSRQAVARVYRAGAPGQRVGDWAAQ